MEAHSFTENFLNNRLPKDISLFYCGHEQCLPGHTNGMSMRSHYLLHYVVRGKGTFSTRDSTYTLQQGESFCMFPGTPGSYSADSSDPWEYYWIGFSGERVSDYLQQARITLKSPLHTHDDSGAIRGLFARLLHQTENKTIASEANCTGLLFQLLSAYMSNAGSGEEPDHRPAKNNKDGYVDQALQLIHASYQRKLTVSMLAGHVGLERAYFTKIFQQRVKASPYEFILQYRMEQALRLLMHTDQPVATIAFSTGFEDPSYFSKIFTQRNGCPPSVFRKRHSSLPLSGGGS